MGHADAAGQGPLLLARHGAPAARRAGAWHRAALREHAPGTRPSPAPGAPAAPLAPCAWSLVADAAPFPARQAGELRVVAFELHDEASAPGEVGILSLDDVVGMRFSVYAEKMRESAHGELIIVTRRDRKHGSSLRVLAFLAFCLAVTLSLYAFGLRLFGPLTAAAVAAPWPAYIVYCYVECGARDTLRGVALAPLLVLAALLPEAAALQLWTLALGALLCLQLPGVGDKASRFAGETWSLPPLPSAQPVWALRFDERHVSAMLAVRARLWAHEATRPLVRDLWVGSAAAEGLLSAALPGDWYGSRRLRFGMNVLQDFGLPLLAVLNGTATLLPLFHSISKALFAAAAADRGVVWVLGYLPHLRDLALAATKAAAALLNALHLRLPMLSLSRRLRRALRLLSGAADWLSRRYLKLDYALLHLHRLQIHGLSLAMQRLSIAWQPVQASAAALSAAVRGAAGPIGATYAAFRSGLASIAAQLGAVGRDAGRLLSAAFYRQPAPPSFVAITTRVGRELETLNHNVNMARRSQTPNGRDVPGTESPWTASRSPWSPIGPRRRKARPPAAKKATPAPLESPDLDTDLPPGAAPMKRSHRERLARQAGRQRPQRRSRSRLQSPEEILRRNSAAEKADGRSRANSF